MHDAGDRVGILPCAVATEYRAVVWTPNGLTGDAANYFREERRFTDVSDVRDVINWVEGYLSRGGSFEIYALADPWFLRVAGDSPIPRAAIDVFHSTSE